MGTFGIVGPRTCPGCPVNQTVWWALVVDHYTADMLSARQLATIERIHGEPESITAPDSDGA